MNLKKISSSLYVSEQITPSDVSAAAEHGIKTIVCNRPHKETEDQPETQAIVDAAAGAGVEFIHMPVIAGQISDANVTEFAQAYRSSKEPILAYCRSGMRSTALWALTEAELTDVDTILSIARNAGYDLSEMRPRLESQRKPS